MLFKIINSEKGVALVAALGISLILMFAIIAIAINAGFFSTTTKATRELDQLTFTSDYGIENYRYYLWNAGCAPPNWCNALGDQYRSVVETWGNLFNEQQIVINDTSALRHEIPPDSDSGQIIFLKNGTPTEDGNYDYKVFAKTSPNPKILYVMSTAIKRRSAVLQEEEYTKRASIEVALHFSVPCAEDYKQFGQCPSKSGESKEAGIATTLRGVF